MKDCIISHYAKDKDGYAVGYNPKTQRATRHHRQVYEQHHGEIPAGLVVRHKCDNPGCINIDHLELGTVKDNCNDKIKRMRCWNQKVTRQDIYDIRALKGKVTQRELAQRYNVNKSTIERIQYKTSWKPI